MLDNDWILPKGRKPDAGLVSAEFLTLSNIQKKLDVPEQIVGKSKGQKILEVKGKEIAIPSSEKTVVSSGKKPLNPIMTE